jgi:type IV pilus assembly protein PilE
MNDLPEPIVDSELGVSVERFDADMSLSQRPSARRRGFTLIELMVTVVVISVLALIALPSYQQYVRQARRVEAQAELINLQQGLEKWRVNHRDYSGCSSADAPSGCSDPGVEYYDFSIEDTDYYDFSVTSANETSYSIQAAAKGTQTADSNCTTLTLDQDSTKDPAVCWKQ